MMGFYALDFASGECDDGSVVAVEETSSSIPRLAVYYDSTAAGRPFVGGGRLAYEYFRSVGYQPLDADSLARFLAARIADSGPSVVVFATDVLPNVVAPTASDTILLRRYLNAGGKVVWMGEPIGALVRDSTGRPLGMNPRRTESLVGVPMGTMEFDHNATYPTEVGRRWGIDRFFRGDYPIAIADAIQPLAIDELGKTSAWVRVYRPDRPGSGFVQLWGLGATAAGCPSLGRLRSMGSCDEHLANRRLLQLRRHPVATRQVDHAARPERRDRAIHRNLYALD